MSTWQGTLSLYDRILSVSQSTSESVFGSRFGPAQWQGRVQLGSSKLQVCAETGDGDGRCALGGSLVRCRLGAVCQIWTGGLWLPRFRRKILNPRNRKTARYSLMTITFLFNPSPPGLLAHPWVPGGGSRAPPPLLSHKALVIESRERRHSKTLHKTRQNHLSKLNPRPAGVFRRTRPAGGRGGGGRFCPPPPCLTPELIGAGGRGGDRKPWTRRFQCTLKIFFKRSHVRSRSGQRSEICVFGLLPIETGLSTVERPNSPKTLIYSRRTV